MFYWFCLLLFELKIRSFAGAQDDGMDGALAEIISYQKITANAVLLKLCIKRKFVLSYNNHKTNQMKQILPVVLLFVFLINNQHVCAQWTPVYTDEISADNSQIFVVNDILFLKTQDNKTFRSADQGANWQEISSTFTPGFGNVREVVTTFVDIGNEIFTSSQPEVNKHVLYVSTNGGVTFSPRYTFNNATIASLVKDGNALYAVSVGRDIYKSTDNGNSFEKIVLNYLPNKPSDPMTAAIRGFPKSRPAPIK